MNKLVKQRKLTPKQEAFARSVSIGNNLSDSYRLSYNATNMKDTTVNRKASELHSNPLVRARIEELTKIEVEQSIADRTELLQIATKIARAEGEDGIRAAEILKAVEILSRMQGFDAPTKSIAFNVSARRSPEEMREILARQISMSDLPLFRELPAHQGGHAADDTSQNDEQDGE